MAMKKVVGMFGFIKITTGLAQIGEDIYGVAAYDYSGSSVVSADGSVVAISAPLNDGNGDNSGHSDLSKQQWDLAATGEDIEEAVDDNSGSSVSSC